MAYENLGESLLDYYPCRYGKSKLLFRGPRKALAGKYIAFLGGTATYGKFVRDPFPALTEKALGVSCVNLGCVNAGADVYHSDPAVLTACAQARVTVVQLTGAQNTSNRYYTVHPRRNDRFLRASPLLKSLYGDVDYTEFNFTRHLISHLKNLSPERFKVIERELRLAWVERMGALLQKIDGKTLLLWLSTPAPGKEQSDLGDDPLFINAEMVRSLSDRANGVVKVSVTPKMQAMGTEGMICSSLEEPAAREVLGLAGHGKTAAALSEALDGLL